MGQAIDRAAVTLLGEPLTSTSRSAILTATNTTASTTWNAAYGRAVIAYVLQTPQNQVR